VPQVPARNVIQAYLRLREAGLKVAIPSGLFSLDGSGQSLRIRTKPAAGIVVHRGQVVTISFSSNTCVLKKTRSGAFSCSASGTAPIRIHTGGPPADTKVPAFVNEPLSKVDGWVSKHGFAWIADQVPALPASDRPRLLDNYLVVKQSPTPGGVLSIWRTSWILVRVALRPAS